MVATVSLGGNWIEEKDAQRKEETENRDGERGKERVKIKEIEREKERGINSISFSCLSIYFPLLLHISFPGTDSNNSQRISWQELNRDIYSAAKSKTESYPNKTIWNGAFLHCRVERNFYTAYRRKMTQSDPYHPSIDISCAVLWMQVYKLWQQICWVAIFDITRKQYIHKTAQSQNLILFKYFLSINKGSPRNYAHTKLASSQSSKLYFAELRKWRKCVMIICME